MSGISARTSTESTTASSYSFFLMLTTLSTDVTLELVTCFNHIKVTLKICFEENNMSTLILMYF